MMTDTLLIDQIYECAFAPEYWPGVLDGLAEIAGARGGVMFATNLANRNVAHWTSSQSIRAFVEVLFRDGVFKRQQRLANFLRLRNGGFLTEQQVYGSEQEMAADPIYSELLWPAGLGWCAGTSVALPTGDMLVLTVERERALGPPDAGSVGHLCALRPHLARSALMAARLRLERARAASETLALLGLPALVFDECGKVLAANDLIETLTDIIHWRAQDRVALKDRKADALFRQAIETIGGEHGHGTRSFAIRGADGGALSVVHVVPVRRSVRDIFVRSTGVLVLTPVALPQAPSVELIESLFDLSPAEARIARHLAGGCTVGEIAASDGVSSNTVRTQVRGVLEKTGCRRQTEVVALLAGVSPPGLAPHHQF